MNRNPRSIYRLTFIAILAAMTYVVTLFRIPLGQSKIHLANAVCLLSGMLLGPVSGGLAAGLGSALYDALAGGYDPVNVLITFVSKFAMAWVCGLLAAPVLRDAARRQKAEDRRENGAGRHLVRLVLSAAAGALTYVALYMLKTAVYQFWVYHYPPETAWVTMLGKLGPSILNAAAAIVAAPVLFHALVPALRAAGLMEHLVTPESSPRG